jgi:hypothetical protein
MKESRGIAWEMIQEARFGLFSIEQASEARVRSHLRKRIHRRFSGRKRAQRRGRDGGFPGAPDRHDVDAKLIGSNLPAAARELAVEHFASEQVLTNLPKFIRL